MYELLPRFGLLHKHVNITGRYFRKKRYDSSAHIVDLQTLKHLKVSSRSWDRDIPSLVHYDLVMWRDSKDLVETVHLKNVMFAEVLSQNGPGKSSVEKDRITTCWGSAFGSLVRYWASSKGKVGGRQKQSVDLYCWSQFLPSCQKAEILDIWMPSRLTAKKTFFAYWSWHQKLVRVKNIA